MIEKSVKATVVADNARSFVDKLVGYGPRLDGLIAQVYGLQVGATGPLRVKSVVEAIAGSVQRTFGRTIRFALEGAPGVLDRMDQALLHQRAALCRRAADGRIVDGHGDLRPEHVCLLKPPMVIDCLEFNAALRQVDPFDELALLAMECAMAGAAWIGPRQLAGCAQTLADTPPPVVWQVYTAGRALLRARLALAHLLDDRPRTPERWAPQARRYLAQAAAALAALARDDAALSASRRRGSP